MLVQFALVWWLTKTTGSATYLATATTYTIIPEIFISPFAGAIVDRFNRSLIIISDASIAIAIIVLAGLFYFNLVKVWHVFLMMFLRAVGGAFHYPAE
ncbi:MAG: MFS transporter [Anaerolineaceae bacterium]|jgi:DHA3 family macrolide efflux protein-like MFS transporter|nr:MFS transporter [Anaerolineaceae bacterium]